MKKQEFTKQLRKLVSFETLTSNLEANKKALDYVVTLINKKAVIERIKNEGSEVLIASNNNVKSPDVAFLVHIDVVAAKPDQFRMKTKGDRLIGRGVSDMKFSIPMGVALLNQIIENNLKISFSLVITTDEESGGFKGANYLANEYQFIPKCLIVPDGGDNLVFVKKAKGVCQLEVSVTGKPAHASRPWEGENAIEVLIEIVNKLLSKYGNNNKKPNWKTTMNIGQIEGGISVNQVCPSASIKLDFRFPETRSADEIKKEVEGLAFKTKKLVTVKQMSFGSPTFTDTSLRVVKVFLKSMQESVGKEIVIKETYGASDARHFASLEVPVLMIKPIGGDIHTDKEWISLRSCMEYLNGLYSFIKNYEKN